MGFRPEESGGQFNIDSVETAFNQTTLENQERLDEIGEQIISIDDSVDHLVMEEALAQSQLAEIEQTSVKKSPMPGEEGIPMIKDKDDMTDKETAVYDRLITISKEKRELLAAREILLKESLAILKKNRDLENNRPGQQNFTNN